MLDAAWKQFCSSDVDTQLCCERIQTHCFLHGKAINFPTAGLHPRSQDIDPVLALNFAITIWDAEKYAMHYEEKGYGVYTGKLGFFETDGIANVDIDYEFDFQLAEHIARCIQSEGDMNVAYDPMITGLINEGVETRT